jgi:hypothetical protein
MRRSRRIDDLSLSSYKKGMDSEARVEACLQALAIDGVIFSYYRSEPGGELDRQGVDFLVFPQSRGWSISLQVKTSETGRLKHFEDGSHIPCIAVMQFQDDVQLREGILIELSLSTNELLANIHAERENDDQTPI